MRGVRIHSSQYASNLVLVEDLDQRRRSLGTLQSLKNVLGRVALLVEPGREPPQDADMIEDRLWREEPQPVGSPTLAVPPRRRLEPSDVSPHVLDREVADRAAGLTDVARQLLAVADERLRRFRLRLAGDQVVFDRVAQRQF